MATFRRASELSPRTRAPWTLRDLRRALAKVMRSDAIGAHPSWHLDAAYHDDGAFRIRVEAFGDGVSLWKGRRHVRDAHLAPAGPWVGPVELAEVIRRLDRAISEHGADVLCDSLWDTHGNELPAPPRSRPEGQSRPKGTDEVAPQSGDPSAESAKHGGDGNSGEVDHPAETSACDVREGGEPCASDELGTAGGQGQPDDVGEANGSPGSPGPDAAESAPTPATTGAESSEEGEVTPAQARADGSAHTAASDIPQCDAADSAREVGQDEGAATPGSMGPAEAPDEDAESLAQTGHPQNVPSPMGTGGPSCRSNSAFGGVFAHLNAEDRATADPVAIAESRRALVKLFRALEVGAQGEPSPRIQARKLARELVSRRVSLSRCRREEQEPALRLLLCDVSGSCAAVAPELVMAAENIAMGDPGLAVVLHSNGYPIESIGPVHLDRIPEYHGNIDEVFAAWQAALHGRRVGGIVHLGDSDALWLLERLAQHYPGAPIVWLDSYRAKTYFGSASAAKVRELPFTPAAWWWGVNNAARAAIALRTIARSRRTPGVPPGTPGSKYPRGRRDHGR